MTEILERTPFGAVWEDANGDRRFALHTCSACGLVFVPEQRQSDPSALTGSRYARSDHLGTHNPEDFGLAPLETQSYQQTLVADGGESYSDMQYTSGGSDAAGGSTDA